MSLIRLRGLIRNGRVELDKLIDFPDGTGVLVIIETGTPGDHGPTSLEDLTGPVAMERLRSIDFITEDELDDDPVAVERWIDDLRSIPAIPEDPTKEAEWRAWEEKMRDFNREAVRKQFEEGTP